MGHQKTGELFCIGGNDVATPPVFCFLSKMVGFEATIGVQNVISVSA